ncbi:DUF6069 family protein [Nocardioides speluncae]|uniref:DUF6069 family protein n=1 Tax=Nocardioides speluncae TaxID=2670337 RepID=UPI000D6941B5|nr:DUF6069 family protein [Nocardioides speluncae]
MTTTQSQPAIATSSARSYGLVVHGLFAAVLASVAAILVGALAMAAGVDFELPDGGESIPVLGFGTTTMIFSVVGLGLAAALRRWAQHPSRTFVRTAVALTAVSLVPPFLVDANLVTAIALVLTHLVAAAVAIPLIARRLPN